jgi:hypothetical protein
LLYILEAYLQRLKPALPRVNIRHMNPFTFVDYVSVLTVSADTYEIKLTPFETGFNFTLFELANGGVSMKHYYCHKNNVKMNTKLKLY